MAMNLPRPPTRAANATSATSSSSAVGTAPRLTAAPSTSRPTMAVPISQTLAVRVDHVVDAVVTDRETLRRSLPDVAAQVLELCSRTSVDAVGLEKVLSRDPFLSARVVSIANSAMFSPRMPILSVRDAVVRVGLDAVRDVVLMVVANSTMFQVRGFERQIDEMRGRMLASAACARLLARAVRAEAEYGFLAGLLHNIGELVLLERCAQDGLITPALWESANHGASNGASDGAIVRERIAAHHGAVGSALCRAWKLPTGVIDAALFHHDYRAGGKTHLAAHLVAAADELVDYVLPGVPPPRSPPQQALAVADLKLGPADVQSIIVEARSVTAGLLASR
jgi:HD-like signal output (HDOD) protein